MAAGDAVATPAPSTIGGAKPAESKDANEGEGRGRAAVIATAAVVAPAAVGASSRVPSLASPPRSVPTRTAGFSLKSRAGAESAVMETRRHI